MACKTGYASKHSKWTWNAGDTGLKARGTLAATARAFIAQSVNNQPTALVHPPSARPWRRLAPVHLHWWAWKACTSR